ncbi:VWA domain-containing protein [Botrimarina colliarenosi]|nr:VWA domain-containing protein [Botrimarina colliarenosi]
MISTRTCRLTFVYSLAALLVSPATGLAAGDAPGDVDLQVYDAPTGERYFAASFGPVAAPAQPTPMDLVIVADTSASQVGPFRSTTLAAVEACLASLHPEDRVELIAADLDARVLTAAPAAPESTELTAALAALTEVTPLGASELRGAIESAADRLAKGESSRRRAILYIGDGVSMGATKLAGAWADTVRQLRSDRVAVSSFAVGPQKNAAMLASLANLTGGNLYVDDPGIAEDDADARRRGQRVGRVLADWAHADVVWTDSASANDAVLAAYPADMPPLRSDRDTVVIGRLAAEATALEVDALSGDETLAWSAKTPASDDENAYLTTLVADAARDGGLSLTTLGSAGLSETGRAIAAETDRLATIAEQAVAMGDAEGAVRISQAVLQRDPGNLRAQTVQHAADADRKTPIRTAQLEVLESPAAEEVLAPGTPAFEGPVAGSAPLTDGAIVDAPGVNATPSDAYPMQPGTAYEDQGFYPPAEAVVDGRFLNSIDRNRAVFAQLLEKEVQNAIVDARTEMSSDPEGATQSLKLMLQSVERAPELVASTRAGLIDKLQSALREASRQAIIKDELDRERQENLAAAQERRLLLDRMAQKRERMKQLIERFNALIDERRFAEASEVAQIAEDLDPEGVVPRVARVWGEAKRYHELNMELRERRAAMFLEAMYQAEESFMPFPDNVPMVYPDPEKWRELTRLREKYKAVDVAGESPSEKAIAEALKSPLPSAGLDFPDGTPLEEVVTYLRVEYEIEIVLDNIALDELGLGPDEPIQVSLRNVSLRSALRRMLEPLELTYVIDDEVLLITTQEEALTKLTVKVYPVADLVIPIPPPQQGGIGGGGGGGGLGGGGGGGLGGGGGGGQGGGGFGGGGGAFSVPDDLSAVRLAKQPRTLQIEEESAPAHQAPAPQSDAPKAPVGKTIELPAHGADSAAWDAALEDSADSADSLRDATRRLMADKRYGDTTQLIGAAIRAGNPQPWMYESLGIAMQLDGKAQPEIERAVLSAVDLATDANQLVAIADYLVGMGLDRRAVQVYRLALERDPLLQEILGPALAAAKRSNDVDALRWATTAVLERTWPAELQPIAGEAQRVAKALAARLEADGDSRVAERYRNQLAEANRRDCVVRVKWTGEADVDVAVKEPAGGVCWAGEPRTSGGGARIESLADASDDAVRSEAYECSRGFAGVYEVLVNKVWGDVVADSVTVEITVAEGTEAAETQSHQVKLDENGKALVKFNAPTGRRVEPIAEEKLAQALRRQDKVARSVVAQQLSSLADPTAVSLRPDQAVRRRRALAGAGTVGFQPQIVVLPEGTNLSVSAVVSADRRYVRVSPTPTFSVIGDVATFSFSGGGVNPNDQFAAAGAQQAGAAGGFGGVGGGLAGGGGLGGGGLGGGGLGGGGGGLGGGGGGLGGGGGGQGGGQF